MNCVTSLFAWWGCAPLWASPDLFCSVYFFSENCHTSLMLHLVLSSSATFNVCSLHMLWPETEWQVCYGCNTTVVFTMKRTIYFLTTSSNQEVPPPTESTAFVLCHWNCPSRRKLWRRRAGARRRRSDFYYRYFPIRRVMSCGCVKDSLCVPVLCKKQTNW